MKNVSFESSFVNRLLYDIVHKKPDALVNKWDASGLLCYVVAYCYPAFQEKRDWEKLSSFYKLKPRYRNISDYSESGLCAFLADKWICTISKDDISRVLNALAIVDSCDGETVTFKEKFFINYLNLVNVPKDNIRIFGDLEYVPMPTKDTVVAEEVIQDSNGKEETTAEEQRIVDYSIVETTIVEPIVKETKVKPKKQANKPVQEDETLLELVEALKPLDSLCEKFFHSYDRTKQFVWEQKINVTTYNEIKEGLRDAISAVKNINSRKLKWCIRRYADLLTVYTAEWYRREYSGKNNSALKDIGLKGSEAKLILENSSIVDKEKFYYTGDSNIFHLKSLYVLGGLPVKYKSTNLDSLFDEMQDVIEGEKEAVEIDMNFASTVFSESFRDGSLRGFVNACVMPERKDKPFASEDIDSDEAIRRFITRITEGRLRRKFSFYWLLMYCPGIDLMKRKLVVKMRPEENGAMNTYLSYRRLNEWNVFDCDKISRVLLGIKFNNDETFISFATYRNNFSGQMFVGGFSGKEIVVDSPAMPTSEIRSAQLYVKTSYVSGNITEHPIGERVPFDDISVFYPTGKPFEWSSYQRKGNIALVLCPAGYDLENVSEINNYAFADDDKASLFIAHTFTGNLKVRKSDGTIVPLLCNTGNYNLVIDPHCEIIKYEKTHVGEVKIITSSQNSEDVSPDDEKYVPLLLGRTSLSFQLADSDNIRIVKASDYSLKWKDINEKEYSDWNEYSQPPMGLIRIKCIYEDLVPLTTDVYYVPSTDDKLPIIRDLQTQTIRFDESLPIIDVRSSYEGESESIREFVNQKNIFEDKKASLVARDRVSWFKKYISEFIFYIGEETEYIPLHIFRPHKRSEIWLQDELIHVRIGETIKNYHLTVNNRNYCIRTIDEKGEHRHIVDKVRFSDFDEDIQWHNLQTLSHVKTEINGLDFRLFLPPKLGKASGTYEIEIHPRFVDRYAFYFWSLKKEDSPVRLQEGEDYNYVDQYNTSSKPDKPRFVFKKGKRGNGLYFQSLKMKNICKYAPRYWEILHVCDNRGKYYDTIRTYTMDEILAAFSIAVEHNVYFGLFPQLAYLKRTSDKEMIKFFAEYVKSKNHRMNDSDYVALHRLADEFCFDWMFIDAFSRAKVKRNGMINIYNTLLKKSPWYNKMTLRERISFDSLVNAIWNVVPANSPIWADKVQFIKKSENLAIIYLRPKMTRRARNPKMIEDDRDFAKIKYFLNCRTNGSFYQTILERLRNGYLK